MTAPTNQPEGDGLYLATLRCDQSRQIVRVRLGEVYDAADFDCGHRIGRSATLYGDFVSMELTPLGLASKGDA